MAVSAVSTFAGGLGNRTANTAVARRFGAFNGQVPVEGLPLRRQATPPELITTAGSLPMKERVRVFTDITGTAPTAIEPHLEDEINEWLAATKGRFLHATQSECRGETASHLTVSVWYLPEDTDEADATKP